MSDKAFVRLGNIAKPHGIRGEIKVYPYTGQPDKFRHFHEISISADDGKTLRWYEVERSREQGKFALLKLIGVNTRNDAEQLVKQNVFAHRDDLQELDDNEYYWHDFLGRQVVTDAGLKLGQVAKILDTGGSDVLSVRGTGREYLVPVHDDFIVSYDDEIIIMRLPPGLLEINE